MVDKFYLNDSDNLELTNRLFEIVKTSTTYIKTGNFFFKDDRFHKALLDAAKRGVAIFVISNAIGEENRMYREIDVKAETDPHITNLHELSLAGIHIRLCRDLHAKFIISDGKDGMIMSANYTSDSLYCNPEDGVDISGVELSNLEYVFDKLFLFPDTILTGDAQQYRYLNRNQPLEGNVFDSVISNGRLLLTAMSNGNSCLRNCNYHTIYDSMVNLIENAKEYVKIVSWSYNNVTRLQELCEAVTTAYKKGAQIEFYYGTKGESWKINRTIEQLNILAGKFKSCKCIPLQNNHSKCVITEREGMLFTSNIDGNQGLLNGFELGCFLTEEQRMQAINRLNKIAYE
jgi:hypothetical protein